MNPSSSRATHDPLWVRTLLIGIASGFLVLFLFVPLASVFVEAFRKGAAVYFAALTEENARAAITLTLTVAAISVPFNALFGLAASWSIAKFDFKGKSLLLALIDLPFAVSPVVSGLVYVLLFGANGVFGGVLKAMWLREIVAAVVGVFSSAEAARILQDGIKIIFAVPGMVLATVFVTFPFVARELIPLMQAQGSDQEVAGLSLGASGWQVFRRITLPNIKWALFYGVILCNARAMGEFGAVSVVSGHIRGETNTLPLHVEALYHEWNSAAAFACASILSILGIITLGAKSFIEWRAGLRRRNH